MREVNASLRRSTATRASRRSADRLECRPHPRRCRRWLALRGHVLEVIKREVLSRNHRALVVYGDGHFRRYSKWRGTDGPSPPTLLNRIEGEGTRAFSIWTNTTVQLERLQNDIGTWPIPSLTIIRGTRLGALDFKYFAGMETDPPTRMEEQVRRRALPRTCLVHHVRGVARRALCRRRVHEDASGAHGAGAGVPTDRTWSSSTGSVPGSASATEVSWTHVNTAGALDDVQLWRLTAHCGIARHCATSQD